MRINLRPSHWVLLGLIVVFLFTYFGLISWGRVNDALEALASMPAGAQVFHAKVDRADAIFMVFMFLFLTPLALVALLGLLGFTGAMLAGFLESNWKTPGMPDWLLTGVVYLVLAVIAYFTRSFWFPHTQGFFSLLARALVSAYK